MPTLPDSEKNKGYGSKALQALLSWAHVHDLKDIRAVQIQKDSESFWIKNGFTKGDEPNPTNDFLYNL